METGSMTPTTETDGLVRDLRSSAKAFRDHPIYDSEGNGFFITAQAEEMEQAADRIQSDAKRIAELEAERDTPEVVDFAKAVQLEAWHQRDRWGADHDAGKTPLDWFWLVGYLAQKATFAQQVGNAEKALHHTISTAAALANWHLAISGTNNRMVPGAPLPTIAQAEATLGAKP